MSLTRLLEIEGFVHKKCKGNFRRLNNPTKENVGCTIFGIDFNSNSLE